MRRAPSGERDRTSDQTTKEKLMIKGVSAVWLPVGDMDRAVRFYGDVLGLEVTERDGDWSEIDVDGLSIGLNASESPSGDGGALIAFGADGSLEDEVERLKGSGVEFSGEISEHPWGRIVPFKDPDGNDLQLYAPPA
jgi:predicted enzyme related to lactoylglutathione lyase